MHILCILRRLLFILGLTASAFLRADPADDAKGCLMAGIDEVSSFLRGKPAQEDLITLLDNLVDKYFSFTTTTRLAVGPAWREFTPEQKAKLTLQFSRLVIRTYVDQVNGDTPPAVTYFPAVELRAGRIEIPTRVVNGNQTYSISYRLDLDPATKSWRVYDIVAEGVSLVANYRAQFEPILHKSGAAGLINTLETKLADVSAR